MAPKKVSWLPNERVDVTDLDAGTNVQVAETEQELFDLTVLDNYARITSDFRVEISDQTIAPGQFTVYNGVALNRDGQLFTNSDEENTSRSYTLNANGQYFIEVQYVGIDTDVDSRAFWDPTFDNGTDPSGDTRPPGKEATQNVATRISKDWQIVTPVSTTGFDINTDPNSLKIPVAVIQVALGVITGATTVPAQTVLAQAALSGATKIKVLNSRLFPDTFTANLAATGLTITANDRRNGILTLSAGLGANHSAGERLVRTGVSLPQFLTQASSATPVLGSTGTSDQRPRLFQGQEDRGKALATNPASSTAPNDRSDVELQTLKDHVDFLSAQIREMRFGAELSADMGTVAPPTAFAVPPRYFHRSGSIQGTRVYTVSVGNGTTTWGDFNVNAYADFYACMTAAIAALPSTGGGILLKDGTYSVVNSAITISGHTQVVVKGESRNGTVINCTGSASAFTIPTNTTLILQDLSVTFTGSPTADYAVEYTGAGSSLSASNCLIDGIGTSAPTTAAINNGYFRDCTIRSLTGGNLVAVDGNFASTFFDNCVISPSSVDAATGTSRSIRMANSKACVNVGFLNCTISRLTNQTRAVEIAGSTNPHSLINFTNCALNDAAFVDGYMFDITASGGPNKDIKIVNCDGASLMLGGLITLNNTSNVLISGCNYSPGTNNEKCINIGNDANNKRITVRDCTITNLGSGTTGAAVAIDSCSESTFDSIVGVNTNRVIVVTGDITDSTISNCRHECTSGGGIVSFDITEPSHLNINGCSSFNVSKTGTELIGFCLRDAIKDVSLVGCTVQGMTSTTQSSYGVKIITGGATSSGISINGCSFYNMVTGASQTAAGIQLDDGSATTGIMVTGCLFRSLNLTHRGVGIGLSGGTQVTITGNNFIDIGDDSTISNGIILAPDEGGGISGDTTIVGNTFTRINSDGSNTNAAEILLIDTGLRVVIANNTIQQNTSTVLHSGIVVHNTLGTAIGDISISGNTIGNAITGACTFGILVQTQNTSDSRFSITNNLIRGFDTAGIFFGGTGAGVHQVAINGNNMITSTVLPTAGIWVEDSDDVCVGGNFVNQLDATANNKIGIFLDSVSYGNVYGNYIEFGDNDAGQGISLTTGDFMTFVGNSVVTGNPAGAGFSAISAPVTGHIVVFANACAAGATASAPFVGNHLYVMKYTAAAATRATYTDGGGSGDKLTTNVNTQ